jgi:hypothetical protein
VAPAHHVEPQDHDTVARRTSLGDFKSKLAGQVKTDLHRCGELDDPLKRFILDSKE